MSQFGLPVGSARAVSSIGSARIMIEVLRLHGERVIRLKANPAALPREDPLGSRRDPRSRSRGNWLG